MKDLAAPPPDGQTVEFEFEFEVVRVVRVRARTWVEARKIVQRENSDAEIRTVEVTKWIAE